MNDDDLRKCFAMFIVNGLISRASVFDMKEVWEMADALVDAQNPQPEIGLPAIKRRKAKND